MGSHFPTEMSIQHYYWYVQVAEMVLEHEGAFALVKSLINDDRGSKRLLISHLDDSGCTQ